MSLSELILVILRQQLRQPLAALGYQIVDDGTRIEELLAAGPPQPLVELGDTLYAVGETGGQAYLNADEGSPATELGDLSAADRHMAELTLTEGCRCPICLGLRGEGLWLPDGSRVCVSS